MSGKAEKMKDFKAKREKLIAEITALQNQLKAWDEAILMMEGTAPTATPAPEIKQRGKNVKDTVISLVQNAGEGGLNVSALMEKAKDNGIHLDRGSVSSLLSRMKREKVFAMVDGRYFVPKPSEAALN